MVVDGSSDAMLQYPLRWLLERVFPDRGINIEWYHEQYSQSASLQDRIIEALSTYDSNTIVFVHRDAEKMTYQKRRQEVEAAIEIAAKLYAKLPPCVPVVPVRMTEAWLLIDEEAIRFEANNPNGTITLNLPSINKLSTLPDPKEALKELIIQATELSTRRLKKFRVHRAMHTVAEEIEDYSPLRSLSSFARLEEDIRNLSI